MEILTPALFMASNSNLILLFRRLFLFKRRDVLFCMSIVNLMRTDKPVIHDKAKVALEKNAAVRPQN